MKKLVAVVLLAGIFALAAQAAIFNGVADNQRDDLGYYYVVTGSILTNGQSLTGADASSPDGGSIRWISDDPTFATPIQSWQRIDWTAASGSPASLAFTFQHNGAPVYDNNGIAANNYGTYYNATAQSLASADAVGLYTGYSMSNNYDFVYAGYFQVPSGGIVVDKMTAYFTQYNTPGGIAFQMYSPLIGYRMNIWSDVAGEPIPMNTGSFNGDVYTTDGKGGSFVVAPTGVNIVYGTDLGSVTNPIYSVTFTPPEDITLPAGNYWFSSDATILTIPEPVSVIFFCTGVVGVFGFVARRKLLRQG